MTRLPILALLAAFTTSVLLTGCDSSLPGKPNIADRWQPPAAEKNFNVLYQQNCISCHGAKATAGKGGLPDAASIAQPLSDPLYLAIVPKAAVRSRISEGVPGSMMPPSALTHGGNLTEEQVDILTNGIYETWGKSGVYNGQTLPPWSAPLGDAAAGKAAFANTCAGCHGDEGKGKKGIGAVSDPNYLSLVSNQHLRTTVIVGRPDLHVGDTSMPGYRDVAKTPLSEADISNVVAYLASFRPSDSPLATLPDPASNATPAAPAATAPAPAPVAAEAAPAAPPEVHHPSAPASPLTAPAALVPAAAGEPPAAISPVVPPGKPRPNGKKPTSKP